MHDQGPRGRGARRCQSLPSSPSSAPRARFGRRRCHYSETEAAAGSDRDSNSCNLGWRSICGSTRRSASRAAVAAMASAAAEAVVAAAANSSGNSLSNNGNSGSSSSGSQRHDSYSEWTHHQQHQLQQHHRINSQPCVCDTHGEIVFSEPATPTANSTSCRSYRTG